MTTDDSPADGPRRKSLEIGTKLGVYELLGFIGAGGMGEVYRAMDPRLDREVAIKILPPRLADQSQWLARFEREAKAIAAMSHPNILAIYDVGKAGDISFVVTELLVGTTLRETLREAKPPIESTLDYAVQMAEGLAAAHERGIIHRDLKPENVFVTEDGRIKILDFGLAKIAVASKSSPSPERTPTRHSTPGVTMGTVGYMSPEQARGSECDHRSDIFAFGLILHEMLTGRQTFDEEWPMDTVAAILSKPAPLVTDADPTVPPDLVKIVDHCLEKKRERRFQSARDLAFALSAIASGSSEVATAVVATEESFSSIAVLPFADMSPKRDQEYFCDGMAEEVSSALAQIPDLRVTGRTSAFRFKNVHDAVQQIGRELNVDTVLEGSVRAASNRLRVTVKLINVHDGYQLWSERYDREFDDVFAIQDDISRKIAESLTTKLLGREPAARRRTVLPAYLTYLKARFHMNKRTDDGLRKAIALAEQSIATDESYAPAHACLADCSFLLGFLGITEPRVAMERARTSARHALELDGSSSEAHLSLACVLATYDWKRDEAAAEFEAALRHANHATAHYWYAIWHLVPLLEFGSAREHIDAALELDPLSPLLNAGKAWQLYFTRDYEATLTTLETVFEIDSDFSMAHDIAANTLAQTGRHQEAIESARKAVALSPGRSLSASILGYAYAASGQPEHAKEVIEELLRVRKQGYVSAYHIAMVFAGLEHGDETLKWLGEASEERSGWLVFLNVEPRLDFLRDHPEFSKLVAAAALAE